MGLVDPWFDRAGAYLGAWYQLPDNQHVLTGDLLAPDWVAISSDADDRCDLSTLSRIPTATPVFVAAGNPVLSARLAHTTLRVFEVPPSIPVTVDGAGSQLLFLGDRSAVVNSSLLVRIDGVSILLADPQAEPERFEDLRRLNRPVDVAAVVVAHAARDPLCEEMSVSALHRRSAELRAAAIDRACDVVLAADARVVFPYGGPPCFLDPELERLNRWIEPPGVLPDVEQAAAHLRARLPGRVVTSLLPGDRLFPTDELVVDDSRRPEFSSDTLSEDLRAYAYARAVDLSRVHSQFLAPSESLRIPFKTRLESTRDLGTATSDHVRFEVTGPGGGDWDVFLDAGRPRVDLSGRASAAPARIRIASNWLAAAIDGRVTWRQLLRSLRYSIAHVPGRVDDPLLDLLERSTATVGAGTARS